MGDVIVKDEMCFFYEVVELVFAFVGFQVNGDASFACVEEPPPCCVFTIRDGGA